MVWVEDARFKLEYEFANDIIASQPNEPSVSKMRFGAR